MLSSIASRLGLPVSVLLLAAPTRAQLSQYTLTDLLGQASGPRSTQVPGLSDTGFVCGYFLDATGFSRGFRWSPGSPSSLSFLDPPAGGWGNYAATDVNDEGTVVGTFGPATSFFQSQGFRWKDGVCEELYTELGLPGGIPIAINDAGWIVGLGSFGGLLWDPDLVQTQLPELTGALDINNRGQIVGYREEGTAGIARAYLLDHGNVIPLGTLDPRNKGDVLPVAINESGHVVGESWVGIPPNDKPHAFLWTPATGMTELASLNPGYYTYARDINDAGWIVGASPYPTLWAPDGTAVDLRPLVSDVGGGTRWQHLSSADRINGAGQIAGRAWPGGTESRGVLLTPAALRAGPLTPGVAGVANSLTVSGARPSRPTFLFGDFDDLLDTGYTRLPGCGPIGVALAQPRFVSTALADGSGSSVHGWNVPAALAGQSVRLQALQLGGCGVSNVVRVAF